MAKTIIALFNGRDEAVTAVQALLAAKFTATDIDSIAEVGPDKAGAVADAVRQGAVLVAVRALGESGDKAKSILKSAGAAKVAEYPFSWQQHGWEGFEIAPADVERESIATTRELYLDEHEGGEGSIVPDQDND